MDINEFKAQHPQLFAEVFALGESAGSTKEMTRVRAHLTAGKSGDIAVAHEAIIAGAPYDDEIRAKHDAFLSNLRLASARSADSAAVPSVGVAAPAAPGDENKDSGNQMSAADKAKVDAFKAKHPNVEVW